MEDNIDNTLDKREGSYGDYGAQTVITQRIKNTFKNTPNWPTLPDHMKEALDMIALKAGRILNGDANHADSWHDIAGYARLVEKEILKDEHAK